jgi:DNA mismatch repair protein MutH
MKLNPMKLSTLQVAAKLKVTDFSAFPKPGKNKGERGQLLEQALGIANGSDLKDLIDGELKSFTFGESIAVTQVKHCLEEIIAGGVEFEESKVYEKLKQTIYVGFTRSNEYVGTAIINEESDPDHYQELAEDYGYISAKIKEAYVTGKELHTITGPNKLLQIRTKASKSSSGYYTPLYYGDVQLKDKYMAFYLLAGFGKEVVDN